MPPTKNDKELSPVAKGLMQAAAELDLRAAKWEAGDVDDAAAETWDYADGLRHAGDFIRKFARS